LVPALVKGRETPEMEVENIDHVIYTQHENTFLDYAIYIYIYIMLIWHYVKCQWWYTL